MNKVEIKINNDVHKLINGENGLNCYPRICSLYRICMNKRVNIGLCELFGSTTNSHFEIQRE